MAALTSPLDLPNCQLWLDASDRNYLFQQSNGTEPVSLTNDPVGYWGDKSGNNRAFTGIYGTDSTRPIYINKSFNSKPAIRFNGTNSYLTLATPVTSTYMEQTVFVVANKFASTTGTAVVYCTAPRLGTAASSTGYTPLRVIANSLQGQSLGQGNGAGGANTTFTALSTLTTFAQRVSAGDAAIAATGGMYNIRNGKGTGSNSGFTLVNNLSAQMSRIGANILNTTTGTVDSYFDGEIAELIVYNRYLSDLERHLVEYYLALKWDVVDSKIIYAVKNGNYTDPTIWSTELVPATGTEVFSNGFTINLNVSSLNLRRLSCNTQTVNVTSVNGTFVLNNTANIIASPYGFIGPSTYCLTNNVSTGTLFLTGNCYTKSILNNSNCSLDIVGNVQGGSFEAITTMNDCSVNILGDVYGGTATDCYGLNATNNINLTITGNVSAGTATRAHGLNLPASSNTTIKGSVQGCNSNFGTTYGIRFENGDLAVYGNVYGGTGGGFLNNRTDNYAINQGEYSAENTVNIYGNVYGGCWAAIRVYTYGNLNIYGNVIASDLSPALYSTEYYRNAITINGSIINGNNGIQAVFCPKYIVNSIPYNSYTITPNTRIVNLFDYSEDFSNATWTKNRVTVTPNALANPFNSFNSATLLKEDATANTRYINRTDYFNLGTANSIFSIYLKKQSGVRYVILSQATTNGAYGWYAQAMFDLDDGIVTSTRVVRGNAFAFTITLTSMENVGNGWYRCALGATMGLSQVRNYDVALSNVSNFSTIAGTFPSYTGSTSNGIYIYGAQSNLPYYDESSIMPYVSTTAVPLGFLKLGNDINFYAPDAYKSTYLPPPSSVKKNTLYAGVSNLSGIDINLFQVLTGTMEVPLPQSVDYQFLVDNTYGTGILSKESVQKIWSTNVNTLTSNNGLFTRLAKAATIFDVGTTMEAFQNL